MEKKKKNYDVCAPHRKKSDSCKYKVCFTFKTLKMMMKDLYKKHQIQNYRPSTKYGGSKPNTQPHDHRTRIGMIKTIKEFTKKPQEDWINIEPWKSNETLKKAMKDELNPPSRAYKDSQWLSTFDIHDKLKQFSRYYRWRFSSLGARSSEQKNVPNIHVQSSKDICNKLEEDWKNPRRYSSFGFVLNVNENHWVAIFFRRHDFIIEYFDSIGTALADNPRAVNSIIKNLQKQLHKLSKQEWKLVPPKNEKGPEKQEGGSECGMFALYYIERRLMKESRESILNDHKLNDKYVCWLRKKSFREKKEKQQKKTTKKKEEQQKNSGDTQDDAIMVD